MAQQDSCVTIAKSLEDLERATEEITKHEGVAGRAHSIIREIEKTRIIAIAKKHYERTGNKTSKPLVRHLSDQFNYSRKAIENIIYSAL